MTPKSIFIAFTGPEIEQESSSHQMAPGYECWYLNKLKFAEFLLVVKDRIPPVNQNVLNNYERKPGKRTEALGINDEEYTKASWGLLLPDAVPGALVNGYANILFLLNLYSPHFLRPVFYVSDFGIFWPEQREHSYFYYHDQKQADRFAREEFVRFYDLLISESVYASFQADRMALWNKEEWRLFVACSLFTGLQNYENSKYPTTWQRESADMATILEALFTAGTGDNTEVGYKLRKRIAALMAFRFADIEQDIKELYKQRSEFVHGSFFLRVKKDIRVEDGLAILPLPPFEFLYKQKEYIRHTLAAYLYLSTIHRSNGDEFTGCENVIDILEKSVIDLELRAKARHHSETILSLMP